MKMVKFEYGKYAIRKGNRLFGYKYKSLITEYWWKINSDYFSYCLGDYDRVKKEFIMITDKGTPINV